RRCARTCARRDSASSPRCSTATRPTSREAVSRRPGAWPRWRGSSIRICRAENEASIELGPRSMRVLMFGWEFPPHVSGGLGVATEGLVRGLRELGTKVLLVLPDHPRARRRGRSVPRVRIRRVRTLLAPYVTEETYVRERVEAEEREPGPSLYGPNLH